MYLIKFYFYITLSVMKYLFGSLILSLLVGHIYAQKTLMVEKIGTLRKYYYHVGDPMKLKVSKQDTLLRGKLWSLGDSMIYIAELRPFEVHLKDVGSVYKKFAFPRRLGKMLIFGSAGIFGIIVVDHLINNEPVFTPDLFIIAGSTMGAGLISLSLSQKRCRIGNTWKLKILNIRVF
ncbi:MAG: hypothetical protein M0Q38_16090 [Bacteroidales bacterium]|nr:hypothetical protein [Bacteroidales bacterium]